MKRSYFLSSDPADRISGYNVGKYPLHQFAYCHRFSLNHVTIPIRLMSIGNDEWIAGCYRKRERSGTFAVEFVQQGIFHFTQNGVRYDVGPGEVFLVHKEAGNEVSVSDYALKKTMIIDGSAIVPIIKQLGLDKADVIRISRPDELREIFDRTYRICKEMEPGFNRIASPMAYQVLLELADYYQSQSYPNALGELLRYMQDHLSEPITLEVLCRQSGMSSAALHRLFMQYLKSSPIDYLIKMKMNRAEELLSFPQYSIKEISQMLGYSNQFYFSAEFKKRVGASPKAYRKQQ